MIQRWLCISTRANDEITKRHLVWGVAKRYENTIAKVKEGDTLLMYTMQEIVNREVIPSAVTGIYEASSQVYEDTSSLFVTPKALGNEVFPLRIKVKPAIMLHNISRCRGIRLFRLILWRLMCLEKSVIRTYHQCRKK